ncbi:DEAD/DEAH box helicase family protein [Anaerobacillus sp. HL2]|nr:DEAD/DEAH box helicase family protein [Anaerobacillus sp. HL2]
MESNAKLSVLCCNWNSGHGCKNWKDKNQLGGHVWHTTGSGKTMTSFKSAQLIARIHMMPMKVIFLG